MLVFPYGFQGDFIYFQAKNMLLLSALKSQTPNKQAFTILSSITVNR